MRTPLPVIVARAVLTVAWGSLVLAVLASSLPDHPLRPAANARRLLTVIAPEGWAFFTKSPLEPDDLLYRWQGPRLNPKPATLWNGDPRFFFGFRKTARLQMLEIANMVARAPRRGWHECEVGLHACVGRADFQVSDVRNNSVMQTVCGMYVVERQPPLPWSWRRLRHRTYMPSQILLLNAICDGAPTQVPATAF